MFAIHSINIGDIVINIACHASLYVLLISCFNVLDDNVVQTETTLSSWSLYTYIYIYKTPENTPYLVLILMAKCS